MARILTNANVYTPGTAGDPADTVVIEDGMIVFVGSRDNWDAEVADEVDDLGGGTLLPGFVDAHTHPSMVSQSLWHVRLPWTEDVDEILAFVRRYAEEHPKEEAPYLYFEYYPTTAFGERRPTKELLDTAVSDRPVLCQDFSDHEHWVNSRMLELMGVTRDTPDPTPGLEIFVRDADGEPTGLVREFAFTHFLDTMYERLGWRPPIELTPDRVSTFFATLTQNGVTAIFDALIEDEGILRAVTELDRRGDLNHSYEGAVRFRGVDDLPAALSRIEDYQARYRSPHVRVRTLKLFLDGTNELGNSAVLEPLEGATPEHEFGDIAMEADELTDCLLLINAVDVDVHIHLVGDRAFRTACDAVAAAKTRVAAEGAEWRTQVTLSHCELVDLADLHRPAELGVILNWTPHWAGGFFGEEARNHLGAARWERMYRFGEFADSGATVTFGSDVVSGYELHRAAPLFGMQIAATRVDPEYPLDPDRYPGSVRPPLTARLDIPLLIAGYTIDAAKQLRLDDRIGSVEVGKLANLVLLDQDLRTVDPAGLASVAIRAVFFEGRVVSGSIREMAVVA